MKIPIISAPYKRTSVQKDVGGYRDDQTYEKGGSHNKQNSKSKSSNKTSGSANGQNGYH
ncbi:hypothetical protein KQR57_04385 [Bacillus inaquosorum]|nr:hypothetical protein [Bacillus inaquosorum]